MKIFIQFLILPAIGSILAYLLLYVRDNVQSQSQYLNRLPKIELLNSFELAIKETPVKFYNICYDYKIYLYVKDVDALGITPVLDNNGKPIHCSYSDEKSE